MTRLLALAKEAKIERMPFCHVAVLAYRVPVLTFLSLPLLCSALFYRYTETSVLCRTGRD